MFRYIQVFVTAGFVITKVDCTLGLQIDLLSYTHGDVNYLCEAIAAKGYHVLRTPPRNRTCRATRGEPGVLAQELSGNSM